MKLSELILELAGELHRHGDVEVEYADGDGYAWPIQAVRHKGGEVQITYEKV